MVVIFEYNIYVGNRAVRAVFGGTEQSSPVPARGREARDLDTLNDGLFIEAVQSSRFSFSLSSQYNPCCSYLKLPLCTVSHSDHYTVEY